MRLWHYEMLQVLPDKQLLSQWRECCCIAKNLATKGTPNHLLVNRILDYPLVHYVEYCNMVMSEMGRRGFKIGADAYINLVDNLEESIKYFKNHSVEPMFDEWHNDRYLIQCYLNLQEKFDCGGIKYNEWKRVKMFMFDKFGDVIEINTENKIKLF